jgi:hypothetical protein
VKLILLFAVALGAVACTGSTGESSDVADRLATDNALEILQQAQPVRYYPWSQVRESLLDIQAIQASTTATYSYGFTGNGTAPVWECPSIGVPIPSTAQITNPQKPAGYQDSATIAQMEPTGIFTGDSTGTYVICTLPDGSAYLQYWEGEVFASTVPMRWDDAAKRLVPVEGRSSTVEIKVGK